MKTSERICPCCEKVVENIEAAEDESGKYFICGECQGEFELEKSEEDAICKD